MTDEWANRRDERWATRYARSQVRADRIARQGTVDWPPPVPAVSTPTAPDGASLRLCLIGPGEPTGDREYPFIILGYLGALFVRDWSPKTDNEQWIVVVQRQRGPWRGFDTIHRASFTKPADAAAHLESLRHRIEAGEVIPTTPEMG